MNPAKLALSGFAAGAALMFLSDPDRGKRRRALDSDKSLRAFHHLSRLIDKAQRDTANRAHGAACAVQSAFRRRPTDDQVLVQRVRSRLGRLVSHPHAIEVSARNGRIVLKGPVLESEVVDLLKGVRAVYGVVAVEDRLEAAHSSEHISSLQGGRRREKRSEILQQNWTPALRVVAGAAGGALLVAGLRRRGLVGVASEIGGTALLARSICNREFRDIVGIGDGPRVIELEKAVHIHAPVQEVFRFWSDYEKLPRFMSHLKEVRDVGRGRSHWVAEGPGGVSVSWDAELTQNVPNKLLAWRSVPGSTVETEGVVRFEEQNGATCVSIRMFYKPPAGVLGHYFASMFGADPKSEIDDDLVRLKSLIELGKTRAHGVEVRRESFQHA